MLDIRHLEESVQWFPPLAGPSCTRGRCPLLVMSQCLVRDSTRAQPDKNLAWITAFETSYGEVPQVVKRGWVLERDMKVGSKYLRDASLRKLASALSFFSQ